jgi:hypothetical protein
MFPDRALQVRIARGKVVSIAIVFGRKRTF